MKLKIFTTGGSIDKGYSTLESDFVVGEPRVGEVLREANVDFEFEVESLLKKDSLDFSDSDRELILEKVSGESCRHILITHGSDTMPQTARALAGIKDKTIVLTGSMQPAAFKSSDAHFNIGFAIACLRTLEPGVYLVMNGGIFDPDHVVKNREKDTYEHNDR